MDSHISESIKNPLMIDFLNKNLDFYSKVEGFKKDFFIQSKRLNYRKKALQEHLSDAAFQFAKEIESIYAVSIQKVSVYKDHKYYHADIQFQLPKEVLGCIISSKEIGIAQYYIEGKKWRLDNHIIKYNKRAIWEELYEEQAKNQDKNSELFVKTQIMLSLNFAYKEVKLEHFVSSLYPSHMYLEIKEDLKSLFANSFINTYNYIKGEPSNIESLLKDLYGYYDKKYYQHYLHGYGYGRQERYIQLIKWKKLLDFYSDLLENNRLKEINESITVPVLPKKKNNRVKKALFKLLRV